MASGEGSVLSGSLGKHISNSGTGMQPDECGALGSIFSVRGTQIQDSNLNWETTFVAETLTEFVGFFVCLL